MEIPFLKSKKNQQGGGIIRESDQSNDQAILEHIGHELMTSLHKKDIKAIRDALEALVLMIKQEDIDAP